MNQGDNMMVPPSLSVDEVEIIILQGLRELSVILHWVCEAGKMCYPLTTMAPVTSKLAIYNEMGTCKSKFIMGRRCVHR